jgi:hypothetical protein
VDYKGFTKVLTDRLTLVAKKVIGENQAGFIKGRNILEGVVILREVMHSLVKDKGQGMLCKLLEGGRCALMSMGLEGYTLEQ